MGKTSHVSGVMMNTPVVTIGDIVIQGNADEQTVRNLVKERKALVDTILTEFKKLK